MQKGTKLRKYTKEMCDWLKNNYQGKSSIQVAQEMNDLFGLNMSVDNLQNLKSRIRMSEGFKFEPAINSGRFFKGQVAFNKGRHWDEYMSKEKQANSLKTTFKKGNKPQNAVNVGDTAMRYSGSNPNDEGYLCIKVCDGKLNNNWVPMQRYVWEQHYGKIPKGHKVIFLDGNRLNFDINNLALVSLSEELRLNHKKLRFNNADLTKTGLLIVKTCAKALERVKNG